MKSSDAITPLILALAFLAVGLAWAATLPIMPIPAPVKLQTPKATALAGHDLPMVVASVQVVVSNTGPKQIALQWEYPNWNTNIEFCIYSQYALGITNAWYWIGTQTNLGRNILLQSASGLKITNVFYKVLAFSK